MNESKTNHHLGIVWVLILLLWVGIISHNVGTQMDREFNLKQSFDVQRRLWDKLKEKEDENRLLRDQMEGFRAGYEALQKIHLESKQKQNQ